MKFSNKILITTTALLLFACPGRPQEHLLFGSLEAPLIQQARSEDLGENSVKITSEKDGITVKIREYTGDEKTFDNLKVKLKFMMTTAFGSFGSSYPGAISKTVVCNSSLMPEMLQNPATDAFGYITKANNQLNFGICDQKELKFDMIYFVMKCDGGRFYEVKAYRPVSSAPATSIRDLFFGFKCAEKSAAVKK